jgi:hypothetical protein
MLCDFRQLDDGRWQCPHCSYITSRAYPRPPYKECGPADGTPHRQALPDPWHAITSRLTAIGLVRLEDCRGCPVCCLVNGQNACTGMGGGKCQWLKKWADCLNGKTPFPNGSGDCPLWPDKA